MPGTTSWEFRHEITIMQPQKNLHKYPVNYSIMTSFLYISVKS